MTDGPLVKICGITNLEDARFCAGAGADFLGFIQYTESPRYIDPDSCREIIDWIHGPRPVGVFVNEEVQKANRISEAAGFELVQASGAESPAWCGGIDRPVIKAIHVSETDTAATLRDRVSAYLPHVSHILFDTDKAGYWGGTGQKFNWDLLDVDESRQSRFFIAGGLNPANVLKVVEATAPYAVDLSSGLEESPGKKDYQLVSDLFDRLRPGW